MNLMVCIGLIVLMTFLGAFIGYTARDRQIEKKLVSGELMIAPDSDGAFLSLGLSKPVAVVRTDKYITFKVVNLSPK